MRNPDLYICITSLRFPRCPIRNTFPATLFNPSPKLKLYLFHALRTISELSMLGGITTAVTVSLNHSSFCVQFFNPHASTASLNFFIHKRNIYIIWTRFNSERKNLMQFWFYLVALPNRVCRAITLSSPSSNIRSRAARNP